MFAPAAAAAAGAAARAMLSDQVLLGWGAGCFRYMFPAYARHHPDIYYKGGGRRSLWEHAHNDLLQFPIEYGAVGSTLLAAPFLWLAVAYWRRRAWRNPLVLLVILGCTLTIVHAWMDFVFQNPAILVTWAVLLVAMLRWVELEHVMTAGGGPRPSGGAHLPELT